MKIEDAKLFNCGNDFYAKLFKELCSVLETGAATKVYVDCIGHTRNNNVQEIYKEKLIEKYGSALTIEKEEGGYSYSYLYQLI